MTQAGTLISWRTGKGWLVLAGGGDFSSGETEIIDARALALIEGTRPIAYVPTAEGRDQGTGAEYLEYLEMLGGPAGYVVPLYSTEDASLPEIRDLIANAGMVVLGRGSRVNELVNAFDGTAAVEGLAQAYSNGAVIYGVGSGARLMGARMEADHANGDELIALGWLGSAILQDAFSTLDAEPSARRLLGRHPEAYCIGIPERTALALGPKGEVETWGTGKVTISLGAKWQQP